MAAIDFLNPAPLMWSFEREPESLRLRYAIERTTPAACARALASGKADLGLVPVGAYAALPGLLVLPGCAIASLGAIRSLLLVLRTDSTPQRGEEPDLDPPTEGELDCIGTVALDASSRTTALHTQILFRQVWGRAPRFAEQPPDLDAMLTGADAAVLIGDPALRALRDREARQARTGERLRYLDLGEMWRRATGEAWVSAFWAVRAEVWQKLSDEQRRGLVLDAARSRDAGLAHLPELVRTWAPRLGLRPAIVEAYLGSNIHYFLDEAAVRGVERFFNEGTALGLFPALPILHWAGSARTHSTGGAIFTQS